MLDSHNTSLSCNSLPVPSCHVIRMKHKGWDTVRLPKPRQRKSKGRGRVRTTELPDQDKPGRIINTRVGFCIQKEVV
ncbi:hypothetical protein T265_10837 [Opisthorchis viverrini]|uniref:Uncharacterized protein n=1 Tax=Opisthorchis viverrini TaxID=6198 RepID=A0A074ZZV4_OPIVI|nr:hypothetical protein T265_10837 [Opisthorchis viverrini]KER20664.1 hypothetical protein T265_10837 [Opisthorchis viverrini]